MKSGSSVPICHRIAVVEDDNLLRIVMGHALEDLGHHATLFCGSTDVLEALVGGNRFDLLISDVCLGLGMAGTELARAAHLLDAQMPIVLMTAIDDLTPDTDIAALLHKPFALADLEEVLRKILLRASEVGLLGLSAKMPASGEGAEAPSRLTR